MEVETGLECQQMKEAGGKLEYKWVNEGGKVHVLMVDIFIDINPIPNQRISLDNPSTCKLPINGRKYSDINSGNISLVSMGIPPVKL